MTNELTANAVGGETDVTAEQRGEDSMTSALSSLSSMQRLELFFDFLGHLDDWQRDRIAKSDSGVLQSDADLGPIEGDAAHRGAHVR